MKFGFYYDTPIGKLAIAEEDGFIIKCSFFSLPEEIGIKETQLVKDTYNQLKEYFEGKRKNFEVPLKFYGSEFQKKVWQELITIPYGKTSTYGEVARKIKSKNYSRAVGMANNRNPIAIIVPCHRVIGSNNSLTGYAGGLDIKRKLLELENITFQ